MPLFVVIATDKPDSLPLRMANRDAHLAYVGQHPEVIVGGPILNPEGAMAGSMLILDVADRAAVDAYLADDPYPKAGLFADVEVRGWRQVVGTPIA